MGEAEDLILVAPQPDLDTTRQAVEDANLFSSLCTIRRATGTLDSNGQPDLDPASFVPVAGMISIRCMDAPEVLTRPDITDETKLVSMTLARKQRHVLLDGAFLVLQGDLATIDGIDYDVMSVEPDSQGITTRMAVQVRVI